MPPARDDGAATFGALGRVRRERCRCVIGAPMYGYRDPGPNDAHEPMPTLARNVTRQRAASDILMQVVVRVANLALGVVVTGLLVRTLGAKGYGEWGTAFVVLGLVGFFANFGVDGIAIREAAREPENEFEWLGSVMMLRLILLAPVMLVAVLAIVLLHTSEAMLIAGVIMIVAMPFGGIGAIGLIFQLRVDNRVPMLVLSIRSVLWGAAVLAIFLSHGGMIELAIALAVTNSLGSIVQALAARKVAGAWPRPTRKRIRPLLQRAIPVGISGLLVIAYGRIDQAIVFTIKGAREAGLYGSIYILLDSAHFVPGSVLTTMSPVIAAAWPHDPARMRRAARLTLELVCIGSFGALAFATVAAGPFVRLIFGGQFAAAASILPVLGGAFVLICIGYVNDNLVLVMGKQKRRVVIGLVALVVNLVGNFALVPEFGYTAAAWMTLVTEAVVVAMETKIVMDALQIRRPNVSRVARTAVCALVLGGELAAAKALGAPLGALVLLSVISYPALLLGLGGMSVEDILTVLRRRAPVA
jgi:O-antigen/teichoic acid export membrane protein